MARVGKKVHIGKDGVARVKVTYDVGERQRMFDRTGLRPQRSSWVPKDQVREYIRLAVTGKRNRSRRVLKSTGWLKAKAVRIVRQHGRTVVQIKRAAKRRSR